MCAPMSSSSLLLTAAFAIAFAGTAGIALRGADEKPNATAEKRAPLKLNVDRKPINRDAPDRVSYAPIVKKTAARRHKVESCFMGTAPSLQKMDQREASDGVGGFASHAMPTVKKIERGGSG